MKKHKRTEPKIAVQIRLPKSIHAEIAHLARAEQRTIANLVYRLVVDEVERHAMQQEPAA